MLLEQTFDKLTTLQLHGMVEALQRFTEKGSATDVSPTDLVGILADAESAHRDNRKLQLRLKNAKLRQQACIEDVDYRHPRGLSKQLMLDLASSRWAGQHQNVILTGKTGVGKSYLACALAQKACRDGYTVAYRRFSRLLDELAQARADGTYSPRSAASPRPRCSCSTTSASTSSVPPSASYCSTSSKIATASRRRSSRARSSPTSGTP
jgi:DNA replication protein DnaC